ncbi:MAG: alpha/beta fold hydrolase [Gammaproteobacteria bacterium]|nr:alpha/beta fold hydrolase [Gammaproteobacteria bacterium]
MAVTRHLAFAVLALFALRVSAGNVQPTLVVAPGLEAEADYWIGDVERPAVVVLHGFLQTRHFPVVRRIAESFAAEGYSVLLPSLTLGINRRRDSFACEALHTHSMEQDVAELRAWITWLTERSGKRPVVVALSAGGIQIGALLASTSPPEIQRAILIGLSYFGEEQGPAGADRLRARALSDLSIAPEAMRRYALSHCDRYVTSPESLLSYLRWDKARLGAALAGSPVPVTVIYGGRDPHTDRQWMDALSTQGVGLRSVAAAEHFCDLTNEEGLVEQVRDVIRGDEHG